MQRDSCEILLNFIESVNSLGLGGEAKDHQLRQLVMGFSGQW